MQILIIIIAVASLIRQSRSQGATTTSSACFKPTIGPTESIPDKSFTTHTSSSATAAASPSTPAPPPTPTAPYDDSGCSMHMTQWQNDDDAYDDGLNDGIYGCEIRILDGNRNTIGWQVHTNCSTASPLTVNSKLENGLVVTPEAKGDYVQFTLGSESWESSNTGEPGCKVGDWDGSDDPMYRQMDCGFSCPWNGGKCSDGSC